ncbi:hypothetical protein BT67DRAFT_441394 [Trichocladium antarcticum]|uniref:Uncharacterized protein n=1 Tax=Trichocladium antarcticum TaxID=1450529 RepID=A0AAN6ZE37_9PEZI|nr:hypothetical protein BT67DRAFT_441394 [Trichocladium antarcticum]
MTVSRERRRRCRHGPWSLLFPGATGLQGSSSRITAIGNVASESFQKIQGRDSRGGPGPGSRLGEHFSKLPGPIGRDGAGGTWSGGQARSLVDLAPFWRRGINNN